MKRIIYTLIATILVLGCSERHVVLTPDYKSDSCFTAYMEGGETKTSLNENLNVTWGKSDALSIFDGFTLNNKYVLKTGIGQTSATFDYTSGHTAGEGSGIGCNVAYYPYDQKVYIDTANGNIALSINLPSEQKYAVNSFGEGANPMIAVTSDILDKELRFKNLLSAIKFQLTGDATITKIEFIGNNREPICGSARVKASASEVPELRVLSTIDSVITLNCEGGVQLSSEPTSFIISLPADTLRNGFKVRIFDNQGRYMEKTTNKEFVFKRSEIKPIQAFEYKYTDEVYLAPGMYLGIKRFHRNIDSYDISSLSYQTKDKFINYIDTIQMARQQGTLLYYSVDEALSDLAKFKVPENLKNVSIVTFTDGLDQGSHEWNESKGGVDYGGVDENYLNAIHEKINSPIYGGAALTAYSIGILGDDAKADPVKFSMNLESLASSPNYKFEAEDMTKVDSVFKNIAEELTKTTFTQTLSLRMSGITTGTLIRFTLDLDINDFDYLNKTAADSKMYIEGVYNFRTKSLDSVKYYGLTTASADSILYGVKNDNQDIIFTIEGIRTDSGEAIKADEIFQSVYTPYTSLWTHLEEFTQDNSTIYTTTETSALIMLVLDCSKSLGEESFASLKSAAKSFVEILCPPVVDDYNPDNNNSGYSTTPFDGALVIEKEGVKYYMSAYDYNKIGGVPTGYTALGVAVVSGDLKFYVALNDEYSGSTIRWYSTYATNIQNYAPSLEMADVIIERFDEINKSLSLYGGTALYESSWYWTNYSEYKNYTYLYHFFGKAGLYTTTSTSEYKYLRRASEIK